MRTDLWITIYIGDKLRNYNGGNLMGGLAQPETKDVIEGKNHNI